MKELSKYLQAEKIIKDKEIYEAKALIPKICAICLRKGLFFDLNTESKVISCYNFKGFHIIGYYSDSLVGYENGECYTIKNIYQKVKEYKS